MRVTLSNGSIFGRLVAFLGSNANNGNNEISIWRTIVEGQVLPGPHVARGLPTSGDDDARLLGRHSNRVPHNNRKSVWITIVEIGLFIDDFLIPRNLKKKVILILQYVIINDLIIIHDSFMYITRSRC